LAQLIIEHLLNNPVQRFSEPILARRFAVPACKLRRAMKPAVADGTVATTLVDGIRFYLAPSAPNRPAERIVGKGVLTGYESGIRRLCELRMGLRGAGWSL
jgi:hypothetical protein